MAGCLRGNVQRQETMRIGARCTSCPSRAEAEHACYGKDEARGEPEVHCGGREVPVAGRAAYICMQINGEKITTTTMKGTGAWLGWARGLEIHGPSPGAFHCIAPQWDGLRFCCIVRSPSLPIVANREARSRAGAWAALGEFSASRAATKTASGGRGLHP
ncbi:uncharacterized protein SCHCODRAFT_02156951 [Schizophyllum commune H4-8]|uniref:uncharacterized protein n=1 Tax=Schizophyllum commune (strain H4-8 / FGSC 9210) TaxID=578458 RepID=UPI002160E3EA|nr:uncharacterized protein SCHCODRAFT_02156951 [Schizophyllum commune H4-8]KAI5898130.1 hypothetical protein SCHCODRAFT_02156951 [Schizophyllum commune H4-8]